MLSLFPGAFFIFFKPFGISANAVDLKTYLVILGFGLVSAFFAGIFTLLLPLIFKKSYSNFNIGKAIIHYSFMILLIAIGNFFYNSFWQDFNQLSWDDFLVVLYRTLILAVIPAILIIVWYQNHSLKKNLKSAREINENRKDQALSGDVLISSENEKEQLRLAAKQMLYIESQDNYVMVHFQTQEGNGKKLIRNSLSKIERQLKPHHLIRCHRSFIVNLTRVHHVKGNSRGLQLELQDTDLVIPVSRGYLTKVKEHLKMLS